MYLDDHNLLNVSSDGCASIELIVILIISWAIHTTSTPVLTTNTLDAWSWATIKRDVATVRILWLPTTTQQQHIPPMTWIRENPPMNFLQHENDTSTMMTMITRMRVRITMRKMMMIGIHVEHLLHMLVVESEHVISLCCPLGLMMIKNMMTKST